MKFIMGDFLGIGIIGFSYYNMGGYLFAHLIFFIFAALALIGAWQVIKWIMVGFPQKKK